MEYGYAPTNPHLDSETPSPPQNWSSTPSGASLPTSRAHSGWEASGVPMAKCDLCDKRCRGTVHKCIECRLSVCQTCCLQGRLEKDAKHILDHKSVSWDAHIRTKEDKKKRAGLASSRRGRQRGGGRGHGGRGLGSALLKVSPGPVEDGQDTGSLSDPLVATATAALAMSLSHHIGDSPDTPVPLVSPPCHSPVGSFGISIPSSPRQPSQSLQNVPSPTLSRLSSSTTHRESDRGSFLSQARPLKTGGRSRVARGSDGQLPSSQATLRHHPYGHRPQWDREQGVRRLLSPSRVAHHFVPAVEPRVQTDPPDSYELYCQVRKSSSSFGRPSSVKASDSNDEALPPPSAPNEGFRTPGPGALPPSLADNYLDTPHMIEEIRNELIKHTRQTQEQFPKWLAQDCLHSEVSRAWFHGRVASLKSSSEVWAFKILLAATYSAAFHMKIPTARLTQQWLKEREDELVSRDAMPPLRYSFELLGLPKSPV